MRDVPIFRRPALANVFWEILPPVTIRGYRYGMRLRTLAGSTDPEHYQSHVTVASISLSASTIDWWRVCFPVSDPTPRKVSAMTADEVCWLTRGVCRQR
jgi:hypothetical protein